MLVARRVPLNSVIYRCCSTSVHKSYRHHIGKQPLVYRNMGQHLQIAAERFPNKEALVSIHESKKFTFSTVLERVDRLAAGLYQLGLRQGDRVGVWAPNGAQFYLSTLAAARAGMISVGINPAFQVPELEYSLKKVGVKALIAPERFRNRSFYGAICKVAPELLSSNPGKLKSSNVPSLSAVIIDSDDRTLPGTISFKDLFKIAPNNEVSKIASIQNTISPDSGVNLQFTSGTTGQPKAALLSHYNFVNNGLFAGLRNGFDLPREHRICVQVPFFHVFGMVLAITAATSYGCTLVLPGPGYKPAESVEAIIREKCNVIYGTPTMYVDLVNQVRASGAKLPPVDLAVTGGAPCAPKLFTDMQEVLGAKQVKTIYGLTETTCVCFQSMAEETQENVLKTVGHLGDHCEAKVVDGEGNIVPLGTPGELWIRGYTTMLGYWEDEQKTKETIDQDKWLRTGDQFVLREDGYGEIVGRIKEMVIRGGENIYPREIEDFLNSHPNVLETYCVGVPCERLGEEICAFVRLRNNDEKLDQDDVKKFCQGKLAHYKIPKYVRIVEQFPKTTSGKIQKFKLLEAFLENKD